MIVISETAALYNLYDVKLNNLPYLFIVLTGNDYDRENLLFLQ